MSGATHLNRLCVVLVSTRNPLNIGAAARAVSNFGFTDLRVVHPHAPAFREARSAVGASSILAAAREFTSVAEAVADCVLVVGTTAAGRRELHHPLWRLDQAAPRLRKRLASGRVALLFGSEKVGLSNADLSHCHWLLRIPTREAHRSMNLGQAVAVCLHEIIRAPGSRTPTPRELAATSGDVERLTQHLLEILQASAYFPARPSALTEEKLRRLVRRLHLCAADARLLLGMLRQVGWKLRDNS